MLGRGRRIEGRKEDSERGMDGMKEKGMERERKIDGRTVRKNGSGLKDNENDFFFLEKGKRSWITRVYRGWCDGG